MKEKIDLRIIKTKRNIKIAMISLLNEKDFCSITIQDIIDRALINRSTFYRYYKDKYDLIRQLCTTCFTEVGSIMEERFAGNSHDELVQVTKKMYEYVFNERDTINALTKVKMDDIDLYRDFSELLKKNCVKFFKILHPERTYEICDYLGTIYASVVLSTLRWMSENSYTNYLLKNGKEEIITKILMRVTQILDEATALM